MNGMTYLPLYCWQLWQVALLREVGFDAAFNYHTTPKEQALKDAAPDGIDIYWCGTSTAAQLVQMMLLRPAMACCHLCHL
jgi:NADPH-dependent curcumin reductase CurA